LNAAAFLRVPSLSELNGSDPGNEVFMYRRLWQQMMCVVACSVLIGATAASAQTPAPDNTKTNARDRTAAQKTAGDQSNTRSDLETTREIRKAIVADKDLSSYAHNIKIVTVSGKVTLKGPVHTEAEKTAVAAKAADVAGAANVINHVSVTDHAAPKHPKKAGL
jgi:hyperosmotically inducible protein